MEEWVGKGEEDRLVEMDNIFCPEPVRKGESEAVSLISEMWWRRELIGSTLSQGMPAESERIQPCPLCLTPDRDPMAMQRARSLSGIFV